MEIFEVFMLVVYVVNIPGAVWLGFDFKESGEDMRANIARWERELPLLEAKLEQLRRRHDH